MEGRTNIMKFIKKLSPWHERSKYKPPKWHLHIDGPFWGEGKEFGAPNRVYMWTPWAWIAFAYTPGSRFVGNVDDDDLFWIEWSPR